MNEKLKIGAYAVLAILVIWFGWGFHSNYSHVTKASAQAAADADTSTNAPDTSTNAASATTNAVPAPVPAKSIESQRGAMIGYLIALVAALIVLGIMIAFDFTQFVGSGAANILFDDKGEAMRDPEYERAEQVWANGKHLEAIQLMRDYLKTHPREQHVAIRIAEIYEKDLKNYLAATLENEEVLKKKLPPDRWGWTAIHLCNLYSKMGQQDKARALLERIATEYPPTAAAKKARSRLGIAEPDELEPGTEVLPGEEEPAALAETTPPPPPPEPESNLPPGFRPKK